MSDSQHRSKPGSLDTEVESWLNGLKEKYGEHRLRQFEKEAPIIRAFLARFKKEVEKQQGLISRVTCPLNVGGTGIIFKAAQKNMPKQELVLKLSRPLISVDEQTIIENELCVLPTLNHSNIIRVLDVGKITVEANDEKHDISFIVEPFIAGVCTITEHCKLLFNKSKHLTNQSLDDSLQRLCLLLQQWVDALAYIHEKGYIYLDVKPSNVIVDEDEHVTLIDFGSVEMHEEDDTPVFVYFTERYADPRLKKQASSSTSPDRVKKSVKRRDILFEYDYYALGKSIIELLNDALKNYPHDLPERPLFRSIHFLATRLLNGQNDQEQSAPDTHRIGETFPGLMKSDYSTICYRNSEHSLDDVLTDLKKEIGSWNPENAVPELGSYSKDVLRITSDTYTVLTERLRQLIGHPLFARLKLISQLGLIALVYPAADHTRFDHVLGAYTYTADYVKSLFHDSENPVFRNLVNENDIKAVLLAALLHDLGQYPLAHDLGEVHPQIFGHSRISIELLSNDRKDKDGKTLLSIITDHENGWGVDLECLKQILGAHSGQLKLINRMHSQTVQDFKADLLSSLIDGPIDADKADYLIRDSTECRIPYGLQLDIDRLLHVLTVVLIPEQDRGPHKVTIGVYEKGMASADSFGLARYLLFSSVYWHHTSRIVKSMLQYATAKLLPKEVFGTDSGEKITQIHEKLLHFISILTPPFKEAQVGKLDVDAKHEKIPLRRAPPADVFEDLTKKDSVDEGVGSSEETWYPGISWTDWLMLAWIKTLGDSPEGTRLIDHLLKRDLYKRAYTLNRVKNNESLLSEIGKLSWPQRVKICEIVQENILNDLKTTPPFETTYMPTPPEELEKLCKSELVILLDAPDPAKNAKDERPLYLVPELERKTYYHEAVYPYKADDLLNSLSQLMNSISPVRILCHPILLPWIRTYVKPDRIREILEFAVKQVQR
jgi:HD superfamily phosphohydrolase